MNTRQEQKGSTLAGALVATKPDTPLGQLVREPYRFEFFQAVRLIALTAGSKASRQDTHAYGQSRLGRLPYEEQVRFRAHIGHAFPASAISSFALPLADEKTNAPVPEMTVTFFGLAGTGGILPAHYTQLLIDRVREKDFRLRDFWDLFNHRLIAQFYRAWEKCRFYVRYEQARRTGGENDQFTRMLFSLVGLGTPGLRDRQALPDEALLHYAGHFAHRPRSAVALQQIAADCFGFPTEVLQFQGQWLNLQRTDRTQLTPGGHNRLGISAIAGSRVWGIENKFRLRLRVSRYADFCKFLPGRAGHVSLSQLVRFYVGATLDFDIQIVLAKDEVPRCQLTRDAGMQLGWNTWLGTPPAADVDDAVFACEPIAAR